MATLLLCCISNVMHGYIMAGNRQGGLADQLDPLAEKAEELLGKAEAIYKDNSRNYIS